MRVAAARSDGSLMTSIADVADQLRHSATKEDCLRRAYDILTTKYHGGRLKTVIRCWQLLIRDVDALWRRTGFLHCTSGNALLRALLVRSGWFADDDIVMRWTLLWWISPHQYVRVQVAQSCWVSVDLWGCTYGILFGDYAHGFHIRSDDA